MSSKIRDDLSKYVQTLKLTLVDWLPFQPDMFIRWVPGEKQSTNSIGGSFPNLQEKKSQERCPCLFQTIENAALTVQTQFGVNYEIGKFTTLRIKWYGINIISWKCVRLAFDVSLAINLCTLNRNRGKSCRHCSPCIAAVVGFWQSQRLGFPPAEALITFLVSLDQTFLSLFFLCAMSKRVLWQRRTSSSV